jgi:hypothetical protein
LVADAVFDVDESEAVPVEEVDEAESRFRISSYMFADARDNDAKSITLKSRLHNEKDRMFAGQSTPLEGAVETRG